jgi:hypothetical protein
MINMAESDTDGDLIALLCVSGPHSSDGDRAEVAVERGIPLDADKRLRDLLWRSIDVLSVATVKLAARKGSTYDEVIDEWKALLAADVRRRDRVARLHHGPPEQGPDLGETRP